MDQKEKSEDLEDTPSKDESQPLESGPDTQQSYGDWQREVEFLCQEIEDQLLKVRSLQPLPSLIKNLLAGKGKVAGDKRNGE